MLAARFGHKDSVMILLNAGADYANTDNVSVDNCKIIHVKFSESKVASS